LQEAAPNRLRHAVARATCLRSRSKNHIDAKNGPDFSSAYFAVIGNYSLQQVHFRTAAAHHMMAFEQTCFLRAGLNVVMLNLDEGVEI